MSSTGLTNRHTINNGFIWVAGVFLDIDTLIVYTYVAYMYYEYTTYILYIEIINILRYTTELEDYT